MKDGKRKEREASFSHKNENSYVKLKRELSAKSPRWILYRVVTHSRVDFGHVHNSCWCMTGRKGPLQNALSSKFKIPRTTSIKWLHGVFSAILRIWFAWLTVIWTLYSLPQGYLNPLIRQWWTKQTVIRNTPDYLLNLLLNYILPAPNSYTQHVYKHHETKASEIFTLIRA